MEINLSEEIRGKIWKRTDRSLLTFSEECEMLLTFAFDCIKEQEQTLNNQRTKAQKELEILAKLKETR